MLIFNWMKHGRMGDAFSKAGLFFVLSVALSFSATLSFAAIETNKMVSMQLDSVNGNPSLKIITEMPISYRYTIYDSNDPVRIVLNFPHLEIDAISSLSDVTLPPVQKVEVSSYELTGGRMGRVEVVLSEMADYDVLVNGTEFVLTLFLKTDQVTVATIEPVAIIILFIDST